MMAGHGGKRPGAGRPRKLTWREELAIIAWRDKRLNAWREELVREHSREFAEKHGLAEEWEELKRANFRRRSKLRAFLEAYKDKLPPPEEMPEDDMDLGDDAESLRTVRGILDGSEDRRGIGRVYAFHLFAPRGFRKRMANNCAEWFAPTYGKRISPRTFRRIWAEHDAHIARLQEELQQDEPPASD